MADCDLTAGVDMLNARLVRLSLRNSLIDRCEIASRAGTELRQIAWAVFSVVDKVVRSLALLTYSGVLKPRDE